MMLMPSIRVVPENLLIGVLDGLVIILVGIVVKYLHQ